MYHHTLFASPLGVLTLVASETDLAAILWGKEGAERVRMNPGPEKLQHPVLLETAKQLNDYFVGKRRRFELPQRLTGSEFQKRVWAALTMIPFGETRSYRQIACQIGQPEAARAVGAAIGKNPISIVIPCHRVVGNNGRLTGFAGGLAAKAFLLDREAVNRNRPNDPSR